LNHVYSKRKRQNLILILLPSEKYFPCTTNRQFRIVVQSVRQTSCQTLWKLARATKRTLEWVIYSVKSYLNPWWRLVTIDLRSKSCMCCVLETSLTRNFAADLSLQIFNNRYFGKKLEILVAKLATNFQDLVTKVKN